MTREEMEDELFIRLVVSRFGQVLGSQFNEELAAGYAVDLAKAAAIGAAVCFDLRTKFVNLYPNTFHTAAINTVTAGVGWAPYAATSAPASARPVRKVSASTTAVPDEVLLVDASAGNVTITLPPSNSASSGHPVDVKKTNASGGNVLVVPTAPGQIGGGNITLTSNNFPSVSLVADGISSWWIV